jgi:hypothetical protein
MGIRAVWLIPVAGALALAAFACGSMDPDAITTEPGHGSSLTGPDLDGAIPVDTGGGKKSGDSGTGSTHDGGTVVSGGDSAVESGPADTGSTLEDSPAAAIFGATSFTAMPVATSAETLHSMKGGPKNVTGTACLSCHNGDTKGTAEFLFGGTIYGNVDGGTGASDIEVRTVDDKKNGVSTYSDTNGNFWSESTAALGTPGAAGARNATAIQIMPSALMSGDCNSCHNGTNAALMHVP